MAFDLTALSAWTEEHADEFLAKAVMSAKTPAFMNIVSGFKPGSHKLPTIDHDYDMLQSGSSCTFSESGDLILDQRDLTVESIKTNNEYCIRDLENYFARQVLSPGQEYDGLDGVSVATLERYRAALGKVFELALWNGDKSTAPNALASYDLINGINKVVSDAVAAGDIPAAQNLSGAMTAGNIIASLEAMYDALPVDSFAGITEASNQYKLFIGDDAMKIYERDYRDTHGAVVYNQGFEKRFLDGTNIEIVGVPGLNGSDKALLTKQSNLLLAVDSMAEENDFRVYMDIDQENVRIKNRFAWGIQIIHPDEVVVNNY